MASKGTPARGGKQPSRDGARSAPKKRPAARKAKKNQSDGHKWLMRSVIAIAILVGVGSIVGIVAVSATSVPTANDVATSEATVVYYADGVNEIGRLGDTNRRSIRLSEVPDHVQYAVLAAEDRSFYEHGGISPIGITRAAISNISGMGKGGGGSTITQQYAKIAYLTSERSWERKLKEALLAFKLETVVSKDEILENYLNTIYFGRGAYGIETASLAYFGKPTSELSVAQGAVLAAIINSPNGLAPEENIEGLRARWNYVLDGMVEQGWLTKEERDSIRFPDIREQSATNRLGGQTGFLLGAVTKQLVALGYDETEVQRGGLRIVSTFDKTAQKAAQQAVKKNGPKSGTEGLRIGLAAVRPGTGEVVAMYGGKNFIDDQINNATRQFAQAGSTFKPFALAAAVEQGVPLNSVWDGNSPTTVNGYTFENYGNNSYGDVTLLQATENSINSAYVQLESEIGVDNVADAALRAGVPDTTPGLGLDELNLTFVLGTASPSGLDMASAYATFANRGTRATPTFIKSVTGPNGGLLYDGTPELTYAFDSQTADTVTWALSRVVTNGTGFTAKQIGRPAAAKTGTTDDNKSAWFVGYTPELSVAVLMAKEDAAGMPVSMAGTGGMRTVTGGSFPASIWSAFMMSTLEGQPVVAFPEPPQSAKVGSNCPMVMPEDGIVPIGCPTPEVVEFGPVEPTDLPVPTETPNDPLDDPEMFDPNDGGIIEDGPPDVGGPAIPPEPVNEARP